MQSTKDISQSAANLDTDLLRFLKKSNIGDLPGQTAYVVNYEGNLVHWLYYAIYVNAQLKKVKALFKDRPLPELYFGMLPDLNALERIT